MPDNPHTSLPRSPDAAAPVVLLVDDAAFTRRALKGILEGAGFMVHEASTGAQALELASVLRPDVILLDIELPDIGGHEVARSVKELAATSRIPVIHLSATRVTDGDLVQGLDSGADAYLVHPVEPEVLLSTIRALLRIKSTVERVAALQAFTAALSSAITPAQVAEALLGEGLRAAGATAGALAASSSDGAWLDLVGASPSWPPVLSGEEARVSMSAPTPLSICAWVGEPLWIASRAALEADYPHLPAPALGAVAFLPLSFGGRVRGAVGFAFVWGSRSPTSTARSCSPSRPSAPTRSSASTSTRPSAAPAKRRSAPPRRSARPAWSRPGSRPPSASASAPGRTRSPSSPTISGTRSAPSC